MPLNVWESLLPRLRLLHKACDSKLVRSNCDLSHLSSLLSDKVPVLENNLISSFISNILSYLFLFLQSHAHPSVLTHLTGTAHFFG